MTQIKTSALLMFIGFGLLVIGGMAAPPGVYQDISLADRLGIIEKFSSRWKATNLIGAVGVLSTSVGFILLSVYLWGNQNKALLALGSAAYLVSGLAIAFQSYRRMVDPGHELAIQSVYDQIGFFSLLVGALVFGIVLLQTSYPAWLGYLCIGSAVVLGLGAAFYNLAIAEIAYLIPLVIAIFLWRNG